MKKLDKKDLVLGEGDKRAEKRGDKKFASAFLSAVLCALLCMALLCGATAAWFTSSVSGNTEPLKTATYSINAKVVKDGAEVTLADNKFVAEANAEYTVTLTASGTASTGFCVISYQKAGETPLIKELYSEQILSGDSIEFVIKLSASAEITFASQWGTSVKANSPDVTDGFSIID